MKRALIFGTGALAVALAHKLAEQEMPILFASRSGEMKCDRSLPVSVSCEHMKLDLLSLADVELDALSEIDAVYFCAAPKYWLWQQELVPLVERALKVAEVLAVPFVYADNLYAYGTMPGGTMPGAITEHCPYAATSRKGLARKAALEVVLAAHQSARVKAVVVQASDFYGPGVTISLVGKRIFDAVAQGRAADCLGDIDKQHSFTFIDDVAEAMLRVRADENSYGQVWIAPTDKPLSVREFVKKIAEASSQHANFRVAPKFVFWLFGLRDKAIRELREVYYIFNEDFVVNSAKFEEYFNVSPTDINAGIAATLESDVSAVSNLSSSP